MSLALLYFYSAIDFVIILLLNCLYFRYLTIILRAHVGYEMIDSQRGA